MGTRSVDVNEDALGGALLSRFQHRVLQMGRDLGRPGQSCKQWAAFLADVGEMTVGEAEEVGADLLADAVPTHRSWSIHTLTVPRYENESKGFPKLYQRLACARHRRQLAGPAGLLSDLGPSSWPNGDRRP